MGTEEKDLNHFVSSLKKIAKKYLKLNLDPIVQKPVYNEPIYYMRPCEAYHAYKKYVSIDEAKDEVAAESIMIYPPGIPVVIPGEVISEEIINDLNDYLKKGSTIISESELGFIKVVDLENTHSEED